MLSEICPRHVFLDESKTLFFDKDSRSLFVWNPLTEELKPIKYKDAFKKYKTSLNDSGAVFFNYRHNFEAENIKKAFIYNCMYTISASAAVITLFAGFIFAVHPDTENSAKSRLLTFFASTIPLCLLVSYEGARSD